MTPSRFNSRWMYAQSGRTRSCAGAARRNNRASSTASSSSAGSGQPNPRCAVLCRYNETVPTPMAQAWAIARWDNPRSCLRRRTSRIFLTSSLRAGIASPSFRKAKRAVIRLPTSVHDDRNGCSTSPDSVFNIPDLLFNFPGFSVHLPPDWAFKILRITHTAIPGPSNRLYGPPGPSRRSRRFSAIAARAVGMSGDGVRALRGISPSIVRRPRRPCAGSRSGDHVSGPVRVRRQPV